jgi:hypothetical protein
MASGSGPILISTMGVVFLEPGSWFLAPEGAAACASLLPRLPGAEEPGPSWFLAPGSWPLRGG